MRVAIGAKWASEFNTGVGVYTRELIRGLVAAGKGNGLRLSLVRRTGSRFRVDDSCEEVGYRPLPGPLWMVSQNRAFERIAPSMDVLHEPFLGIGKALDTPSVVTIHDLIPRMYPEMVPRSFRFYFQNVLPAVLDHASAVISDSEKTAGDVARIYGVPRSKIHVVPLGADHVVPARPVSADTALSRGSFGGGYFLVVGAGPSKKVGDAIEAFAGAVGELPPGFRLRIVGRPNGEAAEVLQMHPEISKRVVFDDRVSRDYLDALYRGAHTLIHPALYEGFGLVPLEAMRMGVPVVATDGGAIPEVCGSAVLSVPVGDVPRLTDAMVKVQDPETRRQLIGAGRQHSSRFTWDKTARETIRVYHHVTDGKEEGWSEPLRQRVAVVAS